MKTVGINNIIKIILTIFAILFAIYVWPTPYKYMPSSYSSRPLRIHRITGIGETWRWDTGWRVMK